MTNLEKLEHWFNMHGPSYIENFEEWINGMSNLELLETLEWLEDYEPKLP